MKGQDVIIERARSLHRVVRALHDGHCPSCGAIVDSREVQSPMILGEKCPKCGFYITTEEAAAAMKEFEPVMKKNLEIFEAWRRERASS